MNGQNFDPFLDHDAITDEMASDLASDMDRFENAKQEFRSTKSKDSAGKMLDAQADLTATIQAIQETIFTQPVMVHEAGEKAEFVDEEGHDTMIQRCKRCGSTLQFWHEGIVAMTPVGPQEISAEEVPWWSPGDVVAKSVEPGGMTMYEIDKTQKLDKHEMPCIDLSDLVGHAD